jgi:hypothetical protein
MKNKYSESVKGGWGDLIWKQYVLESKKKKIVSNDFVLLYGLLG